MISGLVGFTALDGTLVWVHTAMIVEVRGPSKSDGAAAGAVIAYEGFERVVEESVEQAYHLLQGQPRETMPATPSVKKKHRAA